MAESLGQFLAQGIEQIPEEEFLKSKFDPNAPDGRVACAICLEKYSYEGGTDTERPVRILACSHWVGSTCIQLARQKGHNTCPFCRACLFEKEENIGTIVDIQISSADGDNGDWIGRIQSANADQWSYPSQLEGAHSEARSTYEQNASRHAWDMDWHRTLSNHARTRAPRRIPHTTITTTHDARPFVLIPAFELVCPRDVAPLPVEPRRPRGVWLSVRAEAVAINLTSALDSFRALDMLAPPAPQGDPLSAATTELRDWNDLFGLAIDEVVAWCREHEQEIWIAEDLEQRWEARAANAVWRGGNHPPQGLGRAVDALIEFVVRWRIVREVEVWEGLVSGDWGLLGA